MKRIIAMLLLGAVFFPSRAQITINNSDMPVLNDTVRYSTSSTDVSGQLGMSGANSSWDFSFLEPDFQEMAAFKSVLSINPAYMLQFGTSTYGQQGQNINVAAVQSAELYNFYKSSVQGLVCDGRGFEFNSIPVSQTYTGKDVIYRFPLTYGNKDSNTYTTSEANLVLLTMSGGGKRVNEVDGWGSIKTPFGTFDCIRVKSTVTTTDSITTQFIPFPFPYSQTYTEYKWLAKSAKIPILEVRVSTGLQAQTTIKYKDKARPALFASMARFSANKTQVAANSTDTIILTDNSPNNPVSRLWTITPSTYTVTGGTSLTSKQIKLFFTDSGHYTVKLHVNYSAGKDDTIIVDYIHAGTGPKAAFVSDKQTTNTTGIVNFYDSSSGSPVSWQWSFVPATVSFVGGTSASSQNPKVIFDQPGTYSVTLKVTNSLGTNSVTKTNYISNFTTAVKEVRQADKSWSISPNPVTDQFMIRIAKQRVKSMEVIDITGKLYQLPSEWTGANEMQVNTAALRPGLYFVRLMMADGSTEVKRIAVR